MIIFIYDFNISLINKINAYFKWNFHYKLLIF